MNRKGQAAMEFLMTYGWAILAAVIVIGVLAAFGVFSPSKYVPTQCVLTSPFGCDQNQVTASATSGVSFVMRNGGGVSYDVVSVAVTGCGTDATSFTLADQATQTVTVPCSPSLTQGEKFTGDVTILYTATTGGALNLTASGTVSTEVGA